MRFLLPVAILAAALAALLTTPPQSTLLGLDHQRFVSAAIGAALLLWLLLSGLRSARPSDVARVAGAAAIWAALLLGLTGVYAYRYEASDFADRIAGELFPSEPEVGSGGEVIVNQRLGGEFAITGRVNGARVTFLFDTGASAVVLTSADARRAGINTGGLEYDAPVTTANGSALAAEVRLDQVAVGPIVMHNVTALVARPGALDESLLGMSFLGRLKGYAVERGRLRRRRNPSGEARHHARQPDRRLWRNRADPRSHSAGRRPRRGARRRLLARVREPCRCRRAVARRSADPARISCSRARRRRGSGGRPARY